MNIAQKSSTPASNPSSTANSNNNPPTGFNQPKPATTHEAAHLTQPKKSFAFQSLEERQARKGQEGQTQPAPTNTLQGAGASFKPPGAPPQAPPNTNGSNNSQPTLSNKKGPKSKKTSIILLVVAFIFMLVSGAGLFYITQILPETEVPTDPESEPVASVPSPTPQTCSLSFSIDQPETTPTVTPITTTTPVATATPTSTATPEPSATVTTTPASTNTPGPSSTPTNTPAPGDPTSSPTTVAQAPTSTPTSATKQVVDTKADCNEACTTNADCQNISHVCYNGLCRLDVNPEDNQCRTATGEDTVERVVQQPIAGFSDWINYLRIGIGAVGAGLLLLLFL